ncbi:MAG: hypothetical protein HUJ57_01530 [Erysipelotrichaceae bacterium]|nr:hypothetical protein [Erysipelotrichaceae bacterium]
MKTIKLLLVSTLLLSLLTACTEDSGQLSSKSLDGKIFYAEVVVDDTTDFTSKCQAGNATIYQPFQDEFLIFNKEEVTWISKTFVRMVCAPGPQLEENELYIGIGTYPYEITYKDDIPYVSLNTGKMVLDFKLNMESGKITSLHLPKEYSDVNSNFDTDLPLVDKNSIDSHDLYIASNNKDHYPEVDRVNELMEELKTKGFVTDTSYNINASNCSEVGKIVNEAYSAYEEAPIQARAQFESKQVLHNAKNMVMMCEYQNSQATVNNSSSGLNEDNFGDSSLYKEIKDLLENSLSSMDPVVKYDKANHLINISVTAPRGTLSALSRPSSIDLQNWEEVKKNLNKITGDCYRTLSSQNLVIGCSLLLLSDVNNDNTLFASLNGQTYYDVLE